MSVDVRWKQRFQNFDRAFVLLREALERGPAALSPLEKEGVIQRFEYSFELAWKTLKDFFGSGGTRDYPAYTATGHQGCVRREGFDEWPGLDRHARPSEPAFSHLRFFGL